MEQEPTTLQEAIVYFSNCDNCREYLVAQRWPNGVTCLKCGSKKVVFLAKYNRWKCYGKHGAPQFTLKTGTIMEDSPIGLDKWLMVMWQIVNSKNGISSCEVARAIGITQKSAWFLDHRIRFMLSMGPGNKPSGQVEADETYIGGKARNMHKDKKVAKITGTGGKDKTAVMGILERGGQVRTKVIDNTKKGTLQKEIRTHVLAGSAIFTDALKSYEGLDEFQYEVVYHAVEYVRGECILMGLRTSGVS
jgi:transposase-like protein